MGRAQGQQCPTDQFAKVLGSRRGSRSSSFDPQRDASGAATESCREDLGEEGNWERCNEPAEVILWNRELPKEALGPRCHKHAVAHVGEEALGDADISFSLASLYEHRLQGQVTLETCREELPDGERCGEWAEFLLWGKLFPEEVLGPRCFEHAIQHVNDTSLSRRTGSAILHLRDLSRTGASY